MPKLGLSGSVRGAPSNGRPYRDTLSRPPKARCADRPDTRSFSLWTAAASLAGGLTLRPRRGL